MTVRPEQAQARPGEACLPRPRAQGAGADASADHVSVSVTCNLAARETLLAHLRDTCLGPSPHILTELTGGGSPAKVETNNEFPVPEAAPQVGVRNPPPVQEGKHGPGRCMPAPGWVGT